MPALADGWIWLVVHAASVIVSLETARRMVISSLPRLRSPELITDVWGPLALLIPLLFAVLRVEDSVQGVGWLLFGAPPATLMIAVGLALTVGHRDALELRWLQTVGVGAGVLLLLLGAAHDVTMWIGQCAFVAAALLLWINTPVDDVHQQENVEPDGVRAGVGVMLMIAASIVQGVAMLMMPAKMLSVAAAVNMAAIAATIAAAARLAGPSSAVRLGGWTAVFGLLFGLGLISLRHLWPRVMEAIRDGHTNVAHRVANGFGRFAWEATAMLAVMALIMVQHRLPLIVQRILGIGILVGSATLIAVRLVPV